MPLRLVLLIPLCSVLLAVCVVSGQSSAPSPNQPQESQETSATLRAQLAIMKDFDQRLVATVYWALSAIAALTLILVGFSWLLNFRIYDRDKAALTQELRSLLTQESAAQQARIAEQFADLQQEMTKDLRERERLLGKAVESAAENAVQPVRLELEKLSQRFTQASRELSGVERSVKQIEAREWETRGVWMNALRSYTKVLAASISENVEWQVAADLEKIRKTLEQMISANASWFASDVAALVALLDSIPPQHTIGVKAVKELAARVRRDAL
jgi:regulator of replication initiation timing